MCWRPAGSIASTSPLGLGYDFPRGVTGDYLHFPYPYLVEVPGYDVRVVRLANEGESRTCRRLARKNGKTILQACGLLPRKPKRGGWISAGDLDPCLPVDRQPTRAPSYRWTDPGDPCAYCRDALSMILKACPEIQGLTLRVHGESGIPEGSYPFWKTLFEAISGCGRKIEIDMHAKGVNQTMIDMATATGMPVKLGAKYSAEHQSLGYNQADIRAAGDTAGRAHGKRSFQRQQWRAPFYPLRLCRLSCRRAGITICCFACGRERSGICFPAIRRWLRLSGALPASAARSGWISWSRSRSRDARARALPGGRCAYADASLNPKAAIGKNSNTSIASGDDVSITRTLIRRAGADT